MSFFVKLILFLHDNNDSKTKLTLCKQLIIRHFCTLYHSLFLYLHTVHNLFAFEDRQATFIPSLKTRKRKLTSLSTRSIYKTLFALIPLRSEKCHVKGKDLSLLSYMRHIYIYISHLVDRIRGTVCRLTFNRIT